MSCPILLYQPQPQQQLQIIIEPELQEEYQYITPTSPLLLSCVQPFSIFNFISLHYGYQEQVGSFLKIQDFISTEILLQISSDFLFSSLSSSNNSSSNSFASMTPQHALMTLSKLYCSSYSDKKEFINTLATFSYLPISSYHSMIDHMTLYAHEFQRYLHFLSILNKDTMPPIEQLIIAFEESIGNNQLPQIVNLQQLRSCNFTDFQDFLMNFISLVEENLTLTIDFTSPLPPDVRDTISPSIDHTISTSSSNISPLFLLISTYIDYFNRSMPDSTLCHYDIIYFLIYNSYSLTYVVFDLLPSRVIQSSICKLCEYLIHSTRTPSIILYRDCVGT